MPPQSLGSTIGTSTGEQLQAVQPMAETAEIAAAPTADARGLPAVASDAASASARPVSGAAGTTTTTRSRRTLSAMDVLGGASRRQAHSWLSGGAYVPSPLSQSDAPSPQQASAAGTADTASGSVLPVPILTGGALLAVEAAHIDQPVTDASTAKPGVIAVNTAGAAEGSNISPVRLVRSQSGGGVRTSTPAAASAATLSSGAALGGMGGCPSGSIEFEPLSPIAAEREGENGTGALLPYASAAGALRRETLHQNGSSAAAGRSQSAEGGIGASGVNAGPAQSAPHGSVTRKRRNLWGSLRHGWKRSLDFLNTPLPLRPEDYRAAQKRRRQRKEAEAAAAGAAAGSQQGDGGGGRNYSNDLAGVAMGSEERRDATDALALQARPLKFDRELEAAAELEGPGGGRARERPST